jgi:hypothetical protein
MRTIVSAAALALAVISAGVAAAEPRTLPLQPLRERLRTIEVVVNGVPGTFLLDTGGGITTLSPQFARKIGCKPWGRITGYRMFGDRLDMQRCDRVSITSNGVAFAPTTLAVHDSTPLMKPGAAPNDGALAMDVFADQVVTLDVAGNRLILEDAASLARRIEGATELPMKVSREVWGVDPYVGVDIAEGRLWFLLDSGAGGVMLVSKDNAAAFGLKTDVQEPQTLKFDLAPGVPVEGPVVTPEMMLLGNLGMPFMRDYVLTLDFPRQRLWVKRAGT